MNTLTLSPEILALVPIVIGLTSVFKMYFPSRFAPLASLFFGLAGAILLSPGGAAVMIITGIVVGLSASGLYAGSKATFSPLIEA